MKKNLGIIAAIALAAFTSGCSFTYRTMREPNSRVNFNRNDFTLSEQVTGKGSCTKVLSIDWYRLFHSNDAGNVNGAWERTPVIDYAKIPVVGSFVSDKTASYALYDMMNTNPGYDVVFYPQFESRIKKPVLGIGFFYKKTTVRATARLAKMK